MSRANPFRRSTAFTLVELLVSLLIIAIASVLVLGGISAAKGMANSSKCMSNLRNLHQGCMAYARDNNSLLPFRYIENGRYGGYGDPIWYIAVAPYVGVEVKAALAGELVQPGPFKCPGDKVPWVAGAVGEFRPSCSYAFPVRVATYGGGLVKNTEGNYTHLLTRFDKQTDAVMLIDSVFGTVFNPGNYSTAGAAANDPAETGRELLKRHNGYLNAVFVDGHVEKIKGNTPAFVPERPDLW